jgi:hypothetical protein
LGRLNEVTEQLQEAQARLAELEKQKTPPPAFVKANVKKPPAEEKKARQAARCCFERCSVIVAFSMPQESCICNY